MKYALGDLTIDTGRQSVSRSGIPIALPKLSYDLLLVLIRAAPNLVSQNELMRQIWPGLVVSLDTVGKRVTLLRDALDEDSRAPRYIGAIRGRGYQIIAAVCEVPGPIAELPEEGYGVTPRLSPEPTLPIVESPVAALIARFYYRGSWPGVLLAFAVIALCCVGIWHLLPPTQASDVNVDVIPNVFAGTWTGTLETCSPASTYSGPFAVAISNTNSKLLHLVYYGYGPDGAMDLTGSYDLKVAGNQAKSVSPAGITYTLQNEELRVNYDAICQHGSLRKQALTFATRN